MTFVHCRPIWCRFTIWEPLWVLISHKLNPLPMHIFALKLIGSRTWSMTVMGQMYWGTRHKVGNKSNSVNSHFHPKSDWMIKIVKSLRVVIGHILGGKQAFCCLIGHHGKHLLSSNTILLMVMIMMMEWWFDWTLVEGSWCIHLIPHSQMTT